MSASNDLLDRLAEIGATDRAMGGTGSHVEAARLAWGAYRRSRAVRNN